MLRDVIDNGFNQCSTRQIVCTIPVSRVGENVENGSGTDVTREGSSGALHLVKLSDVYFGMEFLPDKSSDATLESDDSVVICCDIDEVILPDWSIWSSWTGSESDPSSEVCIEFIPLNIQLRPHFGDDRETSMLLYRFFVEKRDECQGLCQKALRVHALIRDISHSEGGMDALAAVEARQKENLHANSDSAESRDVLTSEGEVRVELRLEAETEPSSAAELLLLGYLNHTVLDTVGDCHVNTIVPSQVLAKCFYCEIPYADCSIGTAVEESADGRGENEASSTSIGASRGGTGGRSKGSPAKPTDRVAMLPEYKRYCRDAIRRDDACSDTCLREECSDRLVIHPYVPRASSGDYIMLCRPCWRSFLHYREEAVGGPGLPEEIRGTCAAKPVAGASSSSSSSSASGPAGMFNVSSEGGRAITAVPAFITEFASPFANSTKLILPGETNEEICSVCSIVPKELLLCSSCPRAYCHHCVNKLLPVAELTELFDVDSDWNCVCCKWEGVFRQQAAALVYGDNVPEHIKGKDGNRSKTAHCGGRPGPRALKEECAAPTPTGDSDMPALVLKSRGGRGAASTLSRSTETTELVSVPILPPVSKDVDEAYYFSQYIKVLLDAAETRATQDIGTATGASSGSGGINRHQRFVKRRKIEKIPTEDYCFLCKDGGELIECDNMRLESKAAAAALVAATGKKRSRYNKARSPPPTPCMCVPGHPVLGHCTKVYHAYCLEFSLKIKVPEGDQAEMAWQCPRHYCSICCVHMSVSNSSSHATTGVLGGAGARVVAGAGTGTGTGTGTDNVNDEPVTYFMCQCCPISVCSRCAMQPPYRLSQVFGTQKYANARIGSGDSNCGVNITYQPIVCHSCLDMVYKCVDKGDLDLDMVKNNLLDGEVLLFPTTN